MDIIGKRKWFYLASAIVLVPGVIALILWGLRLGIDFSGGSLLELRFANEIEAKQVQATVQELGFEEASVQISSTDNSAIIRTRKLETPTYGSTDQPVSTPIDDTANDQATETAAADEQALSEPLSSALSSSIDEKKLIEDALREKFGEFQEIGFESIGPVIGKELTRKAIYAVIVASIVIVLYIGWSFRGVPRPASSFRFGVCAIAALLHDVFFLLGMFSILGHFFNVEVNALFVTAVLTVMGFSVHDSIVVFDRIREMLRKEAGQPFGKIVNDSILQTMGRSINTTLSVLLPLLALFLFGGESVKEFSFALLIGVFSGAYSSVFNASPLLVEWQNWADKKKIKY
jgi:preprotein translocase subunit SecF